mgnify:CR=1 FL=1
MSRSRTHREGFGSEGGEIVGISPLGFGASLLVGVFVSIGCYFLIQYNFLETGFDDDKEDHVFALIVGPSVGVIFSSLFLMSLISRIGQKVP